LELQSSKDASPAELDLQRGYKDMRSFIRHSRRTLPRRKQVVLRKEVGISIGDPFTSTTSVRSLYVQSNSLVDASVERVLSPPTNLRHFSQRTPPSENNMSKSKGKMSHLPPKSPKAIRLRENTSLLLATPLSCKWSPKQWGLAMKCVDTWTRHPDISSLSVENSLRLLDMITGQVEKSPKDFVLTTDLVNKVVNRWRIGSRKKVVNLETWPAEKVLDLLEGYASRLHPSMNLNTLTYAMIMDAAINQDIMTAPNLCSEILTRMKSIPSSAPINSRIMTHLIDAHVRKAQRMSSQDTPGRAEVARKVQSIFDYMADSRDWHLAPSVKAFTRVLQAWTISGVPTGEALERMEANLDRMPKTIHRYIPAAWLSAI